MGTLGKMMRKSLIKEKKLTPGQAEAVLKSLDIKHREVLKISKFDESQSRPVTETWLLLSNVAEQLSPMSC